MKQPGKKKTRQTTDTSLQPHKKSLSYFCRFVNEHIRRSEDPGYTAVECENQAETVRITKNDLTMDTIDLLLGTLLDTIAHLEKKWRNERVQRLKLEQNPRNKCIEDLVDFLMAQMASHGGWYRQDQFSAACP